MASTRNINTQGNYRLETERDQKYLNYETYLTCGVKVDGLSDIILK